MTVLGDAGAACGRRQLRARRAGSGRVVAVVGLDDVVVVDTPDAVLVTTRARAQDVKRVVAALQEDGPRRPDLDLGLASAGVGLGGVEVGVVEHEVVERLAADTAEQYCHTPICRARSSSVAAGDQCVNATCWPSGNALAVLVDVHGAAMNLLRKLVGAVELRRRSRSSSSIASSSSAIVSSYQRIV